MLRRAVAGFCALGLSLFLTDRKPAFQFLNVDLSVSRIVAQKPLPAGPAHIRLEFQRRERGAHVIVQANGGTVAEGDVAGPIPVILTVSETFDVGYDAGTPVAPDYASSPEFPGKIHQLQLQFDIPKTAPPSASAENAKLIKQEPWE